MVDKTLQAYDQHAEEWAANRTNNDLWREDREWFLSQLNPGDRVVEFGVGTGNAGVRLINAGLDYTGIDGSAGMLAVAGKSITSGRLRLADLREVALQDGEDRFDGFWCAATLLHIPRDEIRSVLRRIRVMLMDGACGFISVKDGKGDGWPREEWDDRLAAPRFFCYWEKDEFADVLTKCGFDVDEAYSKEDGRDGKPRWHCYRINATR
jgi:ubiquinone/menaquinone biosynthesis C-methylase UbiE